MRNLQTQTLSLKRMTGLADATYFVRSVNANARVVLAKGMLSEDNVGREAHDPLNIKGGMTLIATDPGRSGNAAATEYIKHILDQLAGTIQAGT